MKPEAFHHLQMDEASLNPNFQVPKSPCLVKSSSKNPWLKLKHQVSEVPHSSSVFFCQGPFIIEKFPPFQVVKALFFVWFMYHVGNPRP